MNQYIKLDKQDRFIFSGTSLCGYWQISDKKDDEHSIWIDCPKKYIPIIVEALNDNIHNVGYSPDIQIQIIKKEDIDE